MTNNSVVPIGKRYKRKRKKTTASASAATRTNVSIVLTSKKRKRKKKKTSTTNVSTATTANCSTATTTTDDSTVPTAKKHKRKEKKNTTANASTATTTTNNSTVPTAKKHKRKEKKTTNISTAMTTIDSIVTKINDSIIATIDKKHKRPRKKKKKAATNGSTVETTILEALPPPSQRKLGAGKCLITVKLHEAIVNKLDETPRTGRLSEAVVHQHFVEQLGPSNVEWVNQDRDSGLPYDIVITRGDVTEYVEVKEAMASNKRLFQIIQPREWQFMSEKGDSLSIAHVFFSGPDEAIILLLTNPLRLCKKKDMCLALLMLKEFETENTNHISVVLKADYCKL